MPIHHLRRASAALAVLALVFAACGDDDPSTSATPSPTAGTSAAADAPGDDPSAVTSTPPETSTRDTVDDDAASDDTADQVIELSYAEDEVTGGGRIPVALGDAVLVRITSDVADEAHLHGYDLVVALEPGVPAELRFDATIPGVFELELHDARVPLAELEIS